MLLPNIEEMKRLHKADIETRIQEERREAENAIPFISGQIRSHFSYGQVTLYEEEYDLMCVNPQVVKMIQESGYECSMDDSVDRSSEHYMAGRSITIKWSVE